MNRPAAPATRRARVFRAVRALHALRALPRRATLALAAAGGLLLAACSLPTVKPPAQQNWRLQPDAAVRSAPLPEPVVLQLLPVDAAPGLRGPAMLYSRAPDQIEPYRDNRWVDAPASLIGNAIAGTLARQPWVAAVQRDALLVPTPWRLHCTLDRLEHDLRADGASAHLELTCELADQQRRRIATAWRFDARQALASNDAAGFAAAAQTLLDRALAELVQKVRAAVAAAGETPAAAPAPRGNAAAMSGRA